MDGILRFILGLSLAGGATCLLVYALSLPFKKHVKKSWLFYLWLVVLLRFIVPVPLNLPFVTDGINAVIAVVSPAAKAAPVPDTIDTGDGMLAPDNADTIKPGVTTSEALAGESRTGEALANDSVPINAAADDTANDAAGPAAPVFNGTTSGTSVPTGVQAEFSIPRLLPYLWLAGASALLVRTVIGYALTLRRLRRGRALLLAGRVPVYESDCITTPILTGLLRPAVYLPEGFPNPELAIRHELTHCRRGDLWFKWLAQLVVCVHWFNPMVWLMKRELGRLCELACDNAIVRRLGQPERLGYGQMLLDSAHAVADKSGLLVASLGRDKRYLAERIVEIAVTRKTTKKAVAVISLLTAVILTAAVVFGVFLSACTATGETVSPDVQSAPPTATDTATPSDGAPSNIIEGFVNDPDVIGTWEPFNLAQSVSDFIPGEPFKFSSYSLVFAPNGSMITPNKTWTKGSVLINGFNSTLDYAIREIDGSKYLFLKQSDGTPVEDYLGEAYDYYVYKWASEKVEFELYTDDIDLPFVDDPAVHGTWRYVRNAMLSDSPNVSDDIRVESFDLSSPFFGDYANLEMTFTDGGTLNSTQAVVGSGPLSRALSWTKGAVINPYLKTASAYELREISGTTYLIMESKDENYIRSKPENRLNKNYMIWIRNPEPASAEISLPEGAPAGFVDDPALVGTWMPYGTAGDDFEFSIMWRTGYAIVAYENGWTNEPNMTWSKDSLTLTGNYEPEDFVRDYVIREIDGRRFLYVESLASSKYELNSIFNNKYIVYLWASAPVSAAIYTDAIDLPFVNDPAVVGDWKLAASVRSIDDYKPPVPPTYLPQKTMTFSDGGALSLTTAGTTASSGFSWTKGTVIDPYLKTASAYEFREIDGETYLFMENKDTPNYTHMHVVGGYTVWQKIN